MKDRIKQLRSALNLKQTALAAELGLSKNYISLVETGNRTLGDQSIKILCTIYGVNEDWLRTGIGEMFKTPEQREFIKDWLAKVDALPDDATELKTLRILAAFSESEWDAVRVMMDLSANS